MKVLLYGATGVIGSRIGAELLGRGHSVTAAVRSAARADGLDSRISHVQSDVSDPSSVVSAVSADGGYDVVISAVGPSHDGSTPVSFLSDATHALVKGLRDADTQPRLVVVGGAGSLEVSPGHDLVDTPDFPDLYKPTALAHRDGLRYLRTVDDLDWTYFSPAAVIEPGERTGTFRMGGDQLLSDAQGESRISAEDFAIALVDVAESGQPVRQRVSVAY